MRFAACLPGLLAVLLLTGCTRAPDSTDLRPEVEARVLGALPPGTVEIAAFLRRGSQRDANAPVGTERRIVYFDVELRLERDYDFGAWDEPGVAGLISALGAGPRGLKGIQTGGNRAGDSLRAHGALLYAREGDRWVAQQPTGFDLVAAPAPGSAQRGGASESLLGALRESMSRVPPEASPALREAIRRELEHAYAAVNARLARAERGYSIAAGPQGGQYLRLAQAFAADKGSRLVPIVTSGGEENLALLRAGSVDFALSQGDAVLSAYRGDGLFSAVGPDPGLQAIGSLYPEVVHVLVHRDSGLSSVASLRDRRVAIGPAGSAARTTALAVLGVHGLAASDLELRELALGPALVALRERRVDAIVTVIGIPADTVRAAAAAIPLDMIGLDSNATASLLPGSAYLPLEIPAGVYAGVDHPVRTIATPAVLLASAGLSAAEVTEVVNRVYGAGIDLVALGSAQGAQVSVAYAKLGIPVPQHAAATRALASLAARGGATR